MKRTSRSTCPSSAFRLDPRCASGWNNLGAVLFATGELRAAQEAYRRALSLDRGYTDARQNLGMALLRGGAVVEGESELRKATAARLQRRVDRLMVKQSAVQ